MTKTYASYIVFFLEIIVLSSEGRKCLSKEIEDENITVLTSCTTQDGVDHNWFPGSVCDYVTMENTTRFCVLCDPSKKMIMCLTSALTDT